MTRALAASAVCLALLAFTPVADAAQRYASPGGSGAVCSQAAPCSLKEAVTKAESDDEVIVGAGTYTSSEQLLTGEGVQRGQPPRRRNGGDAEADLQCPRDDRDDRDR
jgi:hypothetical protein